MIVLFFLCLSITPISLSSFSYLQAFREEQIKIEKGLPQNPTNAALRKTSEPYISGDSFRKIANHVFDETTRLSRLRRLRKIRHGNIILLNGDFLETFITHIHPRIQASYILITHNSDHAFPGKHTAFLEDAKLLHWFSVNPSIQGHSKFTPIPIGIANPHWKHGNTNIVKQLQKRSTTKSHLVYMNFSIWTCSGERGKVAELFKNNSFVFHSPGNLNFQDYLHDLKQSSFCLSPRGNGLDCHRTWEALLMGCIPIVRSSPLDPIYENLPVVIVNEWEEITETMLRERQMQLQSLLHNEKMYFPYWKQLILNKQKELKKMQ